MLIFLNRKRSEHEVGAFFVRLILKVLFLLLSGSSWFCDLFLRYFDCAQPLPLNYLDAQNLSVCACYCYQISETRLPPILAYINP